MLILPCCSVLSDGVCLLELKGLLTYLLTYLFIVRRIDTKAELECTRETMSRQDMQLIDKERQFCHKLEQARAEDCCKMRRLSSEM